MVNYKRGPGNYKSSWLQIVIKKEDQVINDSTTMQNDDELFVPVRELGQYSYLLVLFLTSHINADIKFAFTTPSGSTGYKAGNIWGRGDIATVGSNITTAKTSAVNNGKTILSNVGNLQNGSTAGILQLQWAQNVQQSEDCTVHTGSYLLVVES